jgi:nucleotidyltransferase substrate binding protein (TIGR01987 family)
MELRKQKLINALNALQKIVRKDLSVLSLDEDLIDSIKNGIAHKFEYSVELFWKYSKDFLQKVEGIEANSPKKVLKSLYLTKNIDDSTCSTLLKMIDDRNILTHVYDEIQFNAILNRISNYLQIMSDIAKKLDEQ